LLSAAAIVRLVYTSDVVAPGELDDAGRRLRMYAYLTAKEARRTYFAIMRVFSATLMADLSAADVSSALASFERDGWIDPGESAIDRVLERLTRLTKWGNLAPGRRETNARSIAEFSHGSVRYQVDKLALRIHRDAEEVLEISLGAREVSREMLPAIERGLEAVHDTVAASFVAEYRSGPASAEEMMLRDRLAEQVTTLFLQHGELADTVRDFYAYVGQVVARHDLNPQEIAGLRGLLAEYIQLVVDEVLQYTDPITVALARLQNVLPEVLRLLAPVADLGDSVERARGRSGTDWQGLADWFVSRPGKISQVEALRDATAKAIGSLLANVKRATGGAGISPAQRTELISLARRFDESTVDGAHALYAEVFGLWPARHWHLAPETDDTLPTVPWRDGARTTIVVPVSSQGDRSGRGRTSKIVEDPLGEQLALEEAERQARQLEAAYAELRAASARLEDVTLSVEALAALYDLLRRATGQLDHAKGIGEFAHARSRLCLRVRSQPGAETRIRAETGTLTVADVGIDVLVL
jgi:uncharacterized protein (TIGR02677 family)